MSDLALKLRKTLTRPYVNIQRELIRRRLSKAFGGASHCYISQNCIGGRLYTLEGRSYTSPTVGLWFNTSDFLQFCENLRENLSAKLLFDSGETKKYGYPVGVVNGIRIYFQHYPSFEEAASAWEKRARRVAIENVVILMLYDDKFNKENWLRFNNLPTNKKILFSYKPFPENDNVIYIPGLGENNFGAGLYRYYHKFNRRDVRGHLFRLLGQE